jgi:hypothetical protein
MLLTSFLTGNNSLLSAYMNAATIWLEKKNDVYLTVSPRPRCWRSRFARFDPRSVLMLK